MPRIDFYLIDDPAPGSVARQACRLTEKAFRHGHRIYIKAESPEQAQTLDDLLWTFRQGSFLPHALHPADTGKRPPILVGHGTVPNEGYEVLINLGATLPEEYPHFERVAELVGADESARELARQRFRTYRNSGCEIQTHNLSGSGDND